MIKEFKDAFETQLLSNGTLASAISNKVYFMRAPEREKPETTGGYIRWTANFGDNIPKFGPDEIELSDITLSIFSRNMASVATIHAKVLRTLDNKPLSFAGYSHVHMHRIVGGNIPPDFESDTRLYHQAVLYEVLYE